MVNSPDSLFQRATGGRPSKPSPDADGVKSDGLSIVGQGGRKASHCSVESGQQDAANQWVGNEPEVGDDATATNSQIGPGVADPAKADAWLDLARAL